LATPAWFGGLKRDLVCSTSVVFIAGLATWVYMLGGQSPLAVGWSALAVALAGAAIAEWLKHGLTGKHLTAVEIFQNMFTSGLLAASASSLTVLRAPGGWSETILLSQSVAAVAMVLYHAVNAYRLAAFGRHLSATAAMTIVATPYLAGSLLVLESARLSHALGNNLTAGLLAAWPAVVESLGRVLVVFGFNEAVANGLGWATKRSLLRSLRAHLGLLAAAAAVIAGPWIAQAGLPLGNGWPPC
jgi:cyclic beta-1,2-glucan synthetase